MASRPDYLPLALPISEVTANAAQADRCFFCATKHGCDGVIERGTVCLQCESPLFPAIRQRLEPSARRILNRVAKNLSITISTNWQSDERLTAVMQDLSLNGLRMLAPAQLETDQLVRIDSAVLRSVARVAHCHVWDDESRIIGVEFVTLRFANSRGNFVSTRA